MIALILFHAIISFIYNKAWFVEYGFGGKTVENSYLKTDYASGGRI